MTTYLNITLTGDKNYVYPLGVVMTSIIQNLSNKYVARFFLFVSDFTAKEREELEKIKQIKTCEIIFFDMEEYVKLFDKIDVNTFKLKYISLATYYRLLMLKILPEDVDKCFYIDGDMIVDTDLSIAYEQMNSSQLASVVIEVLAMSNKNVTLCHLNDMTDFYAFKKSPYDAPYFNAGFFLLNIKKAKQLRLFEAAFDFLARYPNPPYADQDTLNAIIGQKYAKDITYLSPAYNVFCDIDYSSNLQLPNYSKEELEESFKNPKIYHYAGANKPWINNDVKHFYDVWWKYAKLSPWYQILKTRIPKTDKHETEYKLFGFLPLLSITKKRKKSGEIVIKLNVLKILPLCKIKYCER